MPSKELSSAMNALKGGPPGSEEPPEGYTPLSIPQKQQCNAFLRILYQQGLYGKKDLDVGVDQTQGLLDMYRKVNPSFSITKEQIPSIQYEIGKMQQGELPDSTGNFVNIKGTAFGDLVPTIYKGKNISKVEGRIGSLTSTQPYPIAYSKDMNRNWGTDYWGFINGMKEYAANRNKNK